MRVDNIITEINRIPDTEVFGRVKGVQGMLVEIGGVQGALSIGDHCCIVARGDRRLTCEVIGFRGGRALAMPFGALDGVSLGCRVELSRTQPVIYPDPSWLGRTIDALGNPIDDHGALFFGDRPVPIRNQPPPAHRRQRVGGKIELGVRAMNGFLTCYRGQRTGIFAGSGIGKSTLLAMMAKHSSPLTNGLFQPGLPPVIPMAINPLSPLSVTTRR